MLLMSVMYTSTTLASPNTLLSCSEKFSDFEISEENGVYTLMRSVLEDRVKGNAYVRGTRSLESEGNIEGVVSVSKTKDSLVFNLDNSNKITFKIERTEKSGLQSIKILSDGDETASSVIQLNAILGTDRNELSFSSSDACEIK